MDGMYGLHTPPVATADYASERDPAASLMIPADNLIVMADNYHSSLAINQTAAAASSSSSFRSNNDHNNPHYAPHHSIYGSDELVSVASAISEAAASIATYGIRRSDGDDDVFGAVKAKIASHPRYPRLVQAYIDCQKVGAPPEIACLLDEIRRENEKVNNGVPSCLGADPELDEFMEMYCDILTKFKSDLSRPFDEATDFLNKIETQLSNLCQGAFARSTSDDGAVSSDEECSGGEVDMQEVQPRNEERDLKDRLLHRFGSHIGSLKMEFSKKKKKGKLPREARQTLLEWWNSHYKWPYPTEADKIALAETTGLDPRQINNWFINQRKRHWKPSENMQFALMDNLSSGHFFTDDG